MTYLLAAILIASAAQAAPMPAPTPPGDVPIVPQRDATPQNLPELSKRMEMAYPTLALRQERGGTVEFAVLVNRQGRVKHCMVTATSGHADIDDAACRTVTRIARFDTVQDDGPATRIWKSRAKFGVR